MDDRHISLDPGDAGEKKVSHFQHFKITLLHSLICERLNSIACPVPER